MRMIELLYWKYKTIDSILNDIKNQGFDTIKVGPIQFVKKENYFDWKTYNQPIDFKIGNKLGSKNDLNNLVLKANKLGINIIADINYNFMLNFVKKNNDVEEIKKQNLYKDRINFTNLCLLKIISDFLYELSDCNVNGININSSNENKLVYWKMKELLKESNILIYEKNTNYINPFSCYTFPIEDKKITFIENHDTFLFGKETRNLDVSKINSYYELLTYNFSNTLFYPRPCFYPYNEEGKRKNDFGISFNKINELDYFDNTFLISKDIKESNFVKTKK